MSIADLISSRHQIRPVVRRKKAHIGMGCPITGTGNKYSAEVEGLGTVTWGGPQRYIIKSPGAVVWRAVAISARELAMHARCRAGLTNTNK